MKSPVAATVVAAVVLALAVAAPAAAQSLNDLSKMGAGLGGGGGLLGALSSGSGSLASPQNAAGVLGYCQEQGYAPDTASMVKDKLLTKVGGQQKASQDSGYLAGLGGVLQGGDGSSLDLGKLKQVAGEKACGVIA
ncbi:MAG TPA: DUF2501 domain-containing protein, partial [Thalassobaculum sp.]